jgi:hypothetical protein
MDKEDQKDIIKKVKTSGKGDEESSDDTEDTSDETQDTGTEDTSDETQDTVSSDTENTGSSGTEDDSENMFETGMLDEMSLDDWKSKALIKIYDEGDDKIKHILTRLISFNDNINRKSFIKDLQEDHDNDDIQDVIETLAKMGIEIPEPKSELSFMEEANLFLKNPKKNNMFQEGSNDILDEKTKKDACYHKVRSRYDVWPSAYASGALVKCRKVGAANWGNKTNESEKKIQNKY